jgi:hypothetical protein
VNKSAVGAIVSYLGHECCFVADILEVSGACVVCATGPINGSTLVSDGRLGDPTHCITDIPRAGFWSMKRGVFVVPTGQVKVLEHGRKARAGRQTKARVGQPEACQS